MAKCIFLLVISKNRISLFPLSVAIHANSHAWSRTYQMFTHEVEHMSISKRSEQMFTHRVEENIWRRSRGAALDAAEIRTAHEGEGFARDRQAYWWRSHTTTYEGEGFARDRQARWWRSHTQQHTEQKACSRSASMLVAFTHTNIRGRRLCSRSASTLVAFTHNNIRRRRLCSRLASTLVAFTHTNIRSRRLARVQQAC